MADLARRGVLLLAGGAVMAGEAGATGRTAFDFRMEAIEGGPLDLGGFRGRPMLVVNTASFCGYTPQYAGLQLLHDRFGGQGLVVLGVPSNDFNQESADAATIRQFCETNFNVTFPMTMPASVRGPQAVPLFGFLAAQAGGPPRWNFHKYLVARDGRTVRGFPTATARMRRRWSRRSRRRWRLPLRQPDRRVVPNPASA
jgi:glutathione peroxidase